MIVENKKLSELYNIVDECNVSGEKMVDIITYYHGDQIIDDDFIDFVKEELGL